MLRSAVLAFSLFLASHALAQNVTATKRIGGWVIQCTVDAMTDKTSCAMISDGAEVDGARERVFLSWRDTDNVPAVRVASPRVTMRNALVRVDTHKPIEMPACDERATICMPRIEQESALAEQIQSGRRMVLRVDGEAVSRDFVFDLTGHVEARAEFARLRSAAGQPVASRPVDRLERAEIERAAAARVADELKKAVVGSRARCASLYPEGDERRKCLTIIEMCSDRPVPRDARQYRECVGVWRADLK